MNFLERYIVSITELCKKHKVKSLYAFGSVLTDKFTDKSDVDLIVAFKRMPLLNYGDNYWDLKFAMENMFQRPVDLLENKALKNPYFIQNVNQYKRLVYGKRDKNLPV